MRWGEHSSDTEGVQLTVRLLQDLGFLAFTLPQVEILMPTKKPRGAELTLEQQRANQALHQRRLRIEHVNSVVVKYMGDTFLDLSCEKPLGHLDKRGSPVPPEGPPRKCLSAGRVESVVV